MALSRVKIWIAGETLTASDLNAEFANILDNALTLISPVTGNLDLNGSVLILDADADSTLTADTDDRMDIALAGTDLFRFDGTATTPVNGIDFIARATGSPASIQAQGSDTNVALDIRDDNGNELLIFSAVASAVNELTITNAATGNAPILQPSGESNLGISIKDSNSNEVLTLTSTATAVNAVSISNAVASSAPAISPTGDDTNIDLNLTPKGSGDVNITSGTLEIDGAKACPGRGHIDGLVLAVNTADSSHDIDIAAGEATDEGDAVNMILSSSITKQIDAAWAAGTDAGGLDGTESVAGTPDSGTWYHIWLIRRPDTGVVDAAFSENATGGPSIDGTPIPTAYTQYRRIGAVRTNALSNIIDFTQYGDEFLWDVPNSEFETSNPGTSAVTQAIRVPLGIKVWANFSLTLRDTASGNTSYVLITSPDQADTAPTSALHTFVSPVNAGSGSGGSVVYGKGIRTNTSQQIRMRLSYSDAAITVTGTTHGWIDPRGRNL